LRAGGLGVNLERGSNIGMPEQFLLDLNVGPELAKHAREGVSEVVPADSVLAGRLEAGGADPFRLNV